MSLVLPPPPPPGVVYPNTVSPSTTSHSKGSFGTVFIVLAAIIVISAIACIIGRLCNRRSSRPKNRRESQDHNFHPKPRQESQDHTFHPKEGDLEFGFKKGTLTSKPNVNGGRKDAIPSYSFETKEDMKAAKNGDAR
ncbi:uncharacterized protein LOC122075335 [Macadamia integrifolia]|uniref:uncharacterized protein LOC122075335 n=1 Tax=Macadamia integrifolia TaxID=60698 RepID=UPI001C4F4E0E|nr:uncharacterized protein LOC122075335 [Macadamia integrifolia]